MQVDPPVYPSLPANVNQLPAWLRGEQNEYSDDDYRDRQRHGCPFAE